MTVPIYPKSHPSAPPIEKPALLTDNGSGYISWEDWDHFGRILLRIAQRQLKMYRCGAWLDYVSVDTDGQLYACEGLTGVPEACFGSVWEGVDESKVREMAQRLNVTQREPCNTCWARFICGGGCMHQSWLTHGDFIPSDPAECALNKHLIEIAIWFHAELVKSKPEVAGFLAKKETSALASL